MLCAPPLPCATYSRNSVNTPEFGCCYAREAYPGPDQASVRKSHCHDGTGQTAGCGLDVPGLGGGTHYWDEGQEHSRIAKDLIMGCLGGGSRAV